MATPRVPVNSLILDYDLYPRGGIDSQNVSRMVLALEAGTALPPVVIDRKTRKVIDGFHRCKATLRFGGELAEIAIVERDYKNEQEMLLDAGKMNAPHGLAMDKHDRVHFALKARKMGIGEKRIAEAINMTLKRWKYFLTQLRRRGVSLEVAMRLSDHRDLKTVVEAYRAVSDDELLEALGRKAERKEEA